MKEIIYNYDYLDECDINKHVKRAKMIIENNKEELLVVNSHKNYFLIGGHLEEDESFDECIVREIKEETGVDIPYQQRKPFFSIIYLNKDYPNKGENTKYINNYYYIKYDLEPDFDKVELTEDEKDGNFKLEYIHKSEIIKKLTDSLSSCTRKNVVKDTIDVIDEYLHIDR